MDFSNHFESNQDMKYCRGRFTPKYHKLLSRNSVQRKNVTEFSPTFFKDLNDLSPPGTTGCPKKNCAPFVRLLWRSCRFNYLEFYTIA